MERLKRNKLIILLAIATILLIIINIFYFFKTTTCVYNIDQEFYREEIKITITRLQKIKITRTYHFENEEVLKNESQELKDDGYQIKTDNLSLVAWILL